ncbi:MAG TPA: hypothetical protein DIW47_07210 [Bacteroidetes bacterium]|nr:hypothetical protein [Bacteroidota bacterium]
MDDKEYIDIPEIKDEKVKQVIGLMGNPLKLILQGGAVGLLAARKVVLMILLFFLANTFLGLYAIYVFFVSDAVIGDLPWVLAVVGAGIICTALAAYKGYQFVLIEAIRICYKAMNGLFLQFSAFIVDKAAALMQKENPSGNKDISFAMSVSDMIRQRFNKLPLLLRKGVGLILNRVPIAVMVNELRTEIRQGNKEQASQMLFTKMDTFIEDKLFAKNSNLWMWILFFFNLLVGLLIIQYKIG